MNDVDRAQMIERVMAGADNEKVRLASELIKQGWPLSRVREYLDLLENTGAAPIPEPKQAGPAPAIQPVEAPSTRAVPSPSAAKPEVVEPEHAVVPR